MQVLRLGSTGAEVQKWQNFLIGRHYYDGVVEGSFGPKTKAATEKFQTAYRISPVDGVVGRGTLAKAIELGFGDIHDFDQSEISPAWPPRADLLIPSQADRERMFGKFKFQPDPVAGNPEKIKILDDWAKKNLMQFEVPQLKGVQGAPADCMVLLHKLVGPKVQKLFQAWEAEGNLPLVLTWNGTYAARYIRGSRTNLSAHAFGSAFDINVKWNSLGVEPALVGKEGSVRKLAYTAGKMGWFWGGWYKSRLDGMHFEIARL